MSAGERGTKARVTDDDKRRADTMLSYARFWGCRINLFGAVQEWESDCGL